MSSGFELPEQDALIAEQTMIQQDKERSRTLEEYNKHIFPGYWDFMPSRMSEVTDFLGQFALGDEISLENVLAGMSHSKPGQPVHWVDMGGGHGLAQRQFASVQQGEHPFTMTNVDLLPYNLENMNDYARREVTAAFPAFADASNAPLVVQANAETVTLPLPADLITSVETIQYFNNPLRALSNWYNQLTDDGLLVVSTGVLSPFTEDILYSDETRRTWDSQTPAHDILQELTAHGINFAATQKEDDRSGHRPEFDPRFISKLVLQKQPGTTLELVAPLAGHTRSSIDGYRSARYERPANAASPLQVAAG